MFMDTTSPWKLTAYKNVSAGWTEHICMKCDNIQDSYSYDNYEMYQKKDCRNHLSIVSVPPNNPILTFNTVTTTTNIGNMDSFFTNLDATICGITSCSIYLSDCSSAYSGSYISFTDSSPFNIVAVMNIQVGYTVDLCYTCTNNQDVI